MRRTTMLIATLCVGLLLVGVAAYAQQVRGTVVDRNGAARPQCQVDLTGAATYRVWTNAEGAFFLNSPAHGNYTVTVTQGGRSQVFKVSITPGGLSPSNLVVGW